MSKKASPKPIQALEPRNPRQSAYYNQIKRHDLVFGIGPSGTGKTFVVAQHAAEWLASSDSSKFVSIRPTVTVEDEEIGFLPGSVGSKIAPFTTPIVENLQKIAGHERVKLWTARIEFVPIAYIRGRTFDDCLVHVSEAQNVTLKQFKAIVTRIGQSTRLVIEGDPDQSDIPGNHLLKLLEIAKAAGIPHAVTTFRAEDVVRSEMVKRWVIAFALADAA